MIAIRQITAICSCAALDVFNSLREQGPILDETELSLFDRVQDFGRQVEVAVEMPYTSQFCVGLMTGDRVILICVMQVGIILLD